LETLDIAPAFPAGRRAPQIGQLGGVERLFGYFELQVSFHIDTCSYGLIDVHVDLIERPA